MFSISAAGKSAPLRVNCPGIPQVRCMSKYKEKTTVTFKKPKSLCKGQLQYEFGQLKNLRGDGVLQNLLRAKKEVG